MKRKAFAVLLAGGLIGAAARPARLHITTYRDTGCSCCEGWVAIARAAGNDVQLHDLPHDDRLRRFGLTDATAGCHTSLVGGYIVEGHIPLEIVAKLLREKPRVRGIALAGMPAGLAGMGGVKSQRYAIMTLEARPRLFATV